jgi:hypothetical protein
VTSNRFGWPGDGNAQDVYRCTAPRENAPEWRTEIGPRIDDLYFIAALYALEEVIDSGFTWMLPAAGTDPGRRRYGNPGRFQPGVLATLNQIRQDGQAALPHERVDQIKGRTVPAHDENAPGGSF